MLRLRDMTPLRGVTTELDHPQRCGNGRKTPPPYPDALCDLLCCCENKFVMRDFELEWSKQLFANSKKNILNFTNTVILFSQCIQKSIYFSTKIPSKNQTPFHSQTNTSAPIGFRAI